MGFGTIPIDKSEGDGYQKAYDALSDLGWDDGEVLDAIEAMMDAGVIFRELKTR
jgi:hypothetical protein